MRVCNVTAWSKSEMVLAVAYDNGKVRFFVEEVSST